MENDDVWRSFYSLSFRSLYMPFSFFILSTSHLSPSTYPSLILWIFQVLLSLFICLEKGCITQYTLKFDCMIERMLWVTREEKALNKEGERLDAKKVEGREEQIICMFLWRMCSIILLLAAVWWWKKGKQQGFWREEGGKGEETIGEGKKGLRRRGEGVGVNRMWVVGKKE